MDVPARGDRRNVVVKAGAGRPAGMDEAQLAPTVGIVGCVAVLAVLLWPYLGASAAAVSTYYATGPVTPLAAGLFALVGVIVFAAGREERSDPALAAGVALVLGLFVFAICLSWALTARVDVLQSPGVLLPQQRWVLAAVAALVPVGGAWYARALGLT